MTFSAAKQKLFPKQKGIILNVFITAVVCAACFFVPYMLSDSGYFLFFGDFNVQQIPFYQLAHDAVRSGEMGWSFTTDLGANFIGSYSFYLLGSPFFWLTIPFPNSFVPYLMGPLFILKFGCAAVTAYLYISRFTRNPVSAEIGAMLYAFSGFSIYNIFFNHFHEPLIFFPLLLLAFEYLVTENKRGWFALMIALCAIVNYFFFVGMLVFGIIYMFLRFISKALKPDIKVIRWVILEALLGIALATFMLLPSYLAIAESGRVSNISLGWNSILYGKESIYLNVIEVFFFPPDLPARPVMFPKADVKWSSLGAWMPIFSMVGVFAWCKAKEGNWIKRLIATSSVMALVPILNSAFYMFNSAYYARWFFMPILIMCLATSMAIEDNSIEWKKPYINVFTITMLFTLVIGLFPQKNANSDDIKYGLFTEPENPMYIRRFILTVSIAIVGLVVLGFLLNMKRKNFEKFLQTSIICIAICSVLYANIFIAGGKSHAYEDVEMIDNLIENDLKLEEDRDGYRIDVYSGIDNTAMFLGYSSINCFHSIVPTSVTDFWKYVGEERGVASRPKTDSYPTRNLLSVKYLVERESSSDNFQNNDKSTKMQGYKLLRYQKGFNIYENQNYIPYGFSYDMYITEEDMGNFSEVDKAKMMLKAILLDKEQAAKYGHMFTSYNDYYKNGSVYPNFSYETMVSDCAARRNTSAISFECGKNSFEAVVERNKETLVFFSIPYDEGWKAYVNGVEVEVEKVNVGFMAVPVMSGKSTIVFEYETPGLGAGLIISGVALVLLIAYMYVFTKIKENTPEYPEGDELLSQWQEPVIDEELEKLPEIKQKKKK